MIEIDITLTCYACAAEETIDKLHDDCNGYIKKHLKINYIYQNEKK